MSKRKWILPETIEFAELYPQKRRRRTVRFASPTPLPQWQNRKAEHPTNKKQKQKPKYKKIVPATNPSSEMARNGYFS